MSNTKTAIYALCEIPGNRVFYVGKAEDPRRRFNLHLSFRPYDSPDKALEMHRILKSGNKIGCKIIEWVDKSKVKSAEFYWMGFFASKGFALVNDSVDISVAVVDYCANIYVPQAYCLPSESNFDFLSNGSPPIQNDDVPTMITEHRGRSNTIRKSRGEKEFSREVLLRRIKADIARLDDVDLNTIFSCVKGLLEYRQRK